MYICVTMCKNVCVCVYRHIHIYAQRKGQKNGHNAGRFKFRSFKFRSLYFPGVSKFIITNSAFRIKRKYYLERKKYALDSAGNSESSKVLCTAAHWLSRPS